MPARFSCIRIGERWIGAQPMFHLTDDIGMRLYFATDEWIDLGLIRAAELGFDVEGA